MRNAIETLEKNVFKASIYPDEDPQNPRTDWDCNLGVMCCYYLRHNLGDKHDIRFNDFSGWGQLKEHLEKELGAVCILPLYLYDHSGITISTKPFSCPWDSGQVGFIYTTKEAIRKNWKLKRNVTAARLKMVEGILESEVATYDQYLTGDVFGITVTDSKGEAVDSCGGFFGAGYAKTEAQSMLDAAVKNAQENPKRDETEPSRRSRKSRWKWEPR